MCIIGCHYSPFLLRQEPKVSVCLSLLAEVVLSAQSLSLSLRSFQEHYKSSAFDIIQSEPEILCLVLS